MIDIDKVQAALDRAADKAINGTPEDRAGIFCRNCGGRRRALYFSEQAWGARRA